jgi:diguanylate cyclase (GGDEF)-like protein/PAS domain S-box-containing protein
MKDAILRAVAAALDSLEVGFCAFDNQDRALAWNSTFLDFFPEHRGFVHVGEPYARNLRRFYLARLAADELPLIERYIAEGVERHRSQRRPYEFDHRGHRVRVSSAEMGGFGRVRVWRKVAALAVGPADPTPTHRCFNADTTAVLERIADGVLVVDSGDHVLWANQSFLRLYGLLWAEQARGKRFETLYREAWSATPEAPDFLQSLATLRENQRFSGAPFELALPGAQWVRVAEQRGNAVDGRGYFVHVDITALKRQQRALREAEARARESEARYRLLAEYSSDVTLALTGGRITYVSPAVTKLLGWRPEDLEGRPIMDLCHPEDVRGVEALLTRLNGLPEADYRARARHADGTYVWMEARACLPPQAEGDPAALPLVINVRSITARKAIEDELDHARRRLLELAVTDGLTGLANRRRFDEALDTEYRRAQREGRPLSLLMIDIDDFKALNDSHGHPAGDRALKCLATVLASFAQRAGDLAARFGGEEFALLLPHTATAHAEQTAEALRQAVALMDTHTLGVSAMTVSIGVCSSDNALLAQGTPESLLMLADEALYCAKHGGKNRVHVARGSEGAVGSAERVARHGMTAGAAAVTGPDTFH